MAAAAPKEGTANPAPLGLLGFGMTTILLNLHNAGLFPLSIMIAGMGIFVGGLAQIVAGIMEYRKNNTFGMTAFCAYGVFWLSLVAVWTFPSLGISGASSAFTMGFYLVVWGLFTTGMFFGTLKLTRRDLQVNFNWGLYPPALGMGANTFSVRWTGFLRAPATGASFSSTTRPRSTASAAPRFPAANARQPRHDSSRPS